MKRRNLLLMAALAIIACTTFGGPTGRIAIQTHDLGDPIPRRVEATFALGKTALVLLVTWSQRLP